MSVQTFRPYYLREKGYAGFYYFDRNRGPVKSFVNVDTDQIIPKQYLKTIRRTGLKEGLFADWRRCADGSLDPEFFTNQPRYQEASILLTRENFGCGSSRELAPWALTRLWYSLHSGSERRRHFL